MKLMSICKDAGVRRSQGIKCLMKCLMAQAMDKNVQGSRHKAPGGKAQGSMYRVQGTRLRVERYRVQCTRYRVQCTRFKEQNGRCKDAG